MAALEEDAPAAASSQASPVSEDDLAEEEEEESRRILPGGATTRLDHKESVYSFMLFQPPLSRRKTGHYLTLEVALAFALLVLNVTLQVGLTLIAGTHIVQRGLEFKQTLVSGTEAATPWEMVSDEIQDRGTELKELGEESLGTRAAVDTSTSDCCNGAECAELGLPCCDRSGARPHNGHEPMRKNFTQDDVQKLPGGNNHNVSFLSIRKPGGGKKKREKKGKQEGGISNSLCHVAAETGTLKCSPLSFEFIDVWDKLDIDGDGKWTLEEARADEANLGCRLGLPVEEVFRSTCRGVETDNVDTSEHLPFNVHLVPLAVTERRSVPKSYFDWWTGLSVICVAHDVARCGELISKGIFDGAIAAGRRNTKGGVQDLDSALDYCQRMLRPGGMCEKTLPGSYMMYRSRVTEKCGPATYSTGVRYANPKDGRDVMSTIGVKYAMVQQYETASSFQFCFFQGLILFLWFVNLVGEFKAIIQLADFIYSFPHDDTLPFFTPTMRKHMRKATKSARSMSMQSFRDLNAVEDSDEEQEDKFVKEHIAVDSHVISRISLAHKIMVILMLFVRFFLLIYMVDVGSMFLLTNHKYDDLLLNAVALAFIFELPEFLYTFLVSDEMKNNLQEIRTSDYVTHLPTRGWSTLLISKSLWGIVVIPALVIVTIHYNYKVATMPSLQALQCTCFQEGPHCAVAERFGRPWWNAYWKDIGKLFEQSSIFR